MEHQFAWSARAKVHLPMVEKKLHLVLETDPDKNASVEPEANPVASALAACHAPELCRCLAD